MRRYLGTKPTVAVELERKKAELTNILLGVPGLVSYELVRTRDGMFAVTVCSDEASAMEANRRAAAWMSAHIPGFGASMPEVWSGPVTVRVDRGTE